jgi:ParB-like chromosome segregation protein Spo0J
MKRKPDKIEPRGNGDPMKKETITLAPDPRNPNRMTPEDKARMAKSLPEFGDLGCIILNRRTGTLIGGHQRTDVMKGATIETADLPEPEPDGTVARGWLVYQGRRFALRVVDWIESKAKAAMIAANRFGRVGVDDSALLKDLLQELDTGETDMDLTGFDAEELERLMTQYHVSEGEKLAEKIQSEPEWQEEHDQAEKRVDAIAAKLKQLKNQKPEALNKARAIVIAAGSNQVLIIDETLPDVITELQRYVDAGEDSPLAKLLDAAHKL